MGFGSQVYGEPQDQLQANPQTQANASTASYLFDKVKAGAIATAGFTAKAASAGATLA